MPQPTGGTSNLLVLTCAVRGTSGTRPQLTQLLPSRSLLPIQPRPQQQPCLGWPRASLGLELTCPVIKFSPLRALGLLF